MRDQFITDFIQGGAGTSTNMNANEVIANLALESLGKSKGDYSVVNRTTTSISASRQRRLPDRVPLALILRLGSYMEALTKLQEAFFAKGRSSTRS